MVSSLRLCLTYVKKMDILPSGLLHLGKRLYHADLRFRIHGIDEIEDYRDFVVYNGFVDSSVILWAESHWFGAILLHGFCLGICPNKSIQLVVGWKVGACPSGEKSASEVAGASGDEDAVRHFDCRYFDEETN